MAARNRDFVDAGSGDVSDGDIAGAGFRPRGGIALGDFGAGPARVFGVAEEVDAGEAGGEDILAAVAVPIGDEDSVHDARVFGADDAALPFAGDVVDQRGLVAIVGCGGGGAGQGGVDHDEFAGAIDIGGAQAVAGGEAVDFGDGPGFARIVVGAEDADDADAVFGLVGESAGQHDLVAHDDAIDHAALAGGEHVALPAGVFVPDEFGQAAGEGDQVGAAIVIQIGGHHLVAAFEIGGDGVLDQGRRRGGHQGERKQESGQTTHAPQYTGSLHL